MGYGVQQIKDLETTINRVPCDAVIIGTPIDLRRLVNIKKPCVRVMYDLQEIGKPDLTVKTSALIISIQSLPFSLFLFQSLLSMLFL